MGNKGLELLMLEQVIKMLLNRACNVALLKLNMKFVNFADWHPCLHTATSTNSSKRT